MTTPLQKSSVYLEFAPEHVFDCYLDPSVDWNGWAKPYFPADQIEKMSESYSGKDAFDLFDLVDKEVHTKTVDEDIVDKWGTEEVETVDGKLTLFAVGTGAWIWQID